MSQTQQSRPAGNGTARQLNTTYLQGNANPRALPTARAMVFPATGRRTMDAAVVTRCPHCGRGGHLHRGVRLNGAVRESGCNPAREYVLAVVR